MCMWVRAMDLYAHVFRTVEPKRQRLVDPLSIMMLMMVMMMMMMVVVVVMVVVMLLLLAVVAVVVTVLFDSIRGGT